MMTAKNTDVIDSPTRIKTWIPSILKKENIISSLFITVIIILKVDYEKDVRNARNYDAWLVLMEIYKPHLNVNDCATELYNALKHLLKLTLKPNLESRFL